MIKIIKKSQSQKEPTEELIPIAKANSFWLKK